MKLCLAEPADIKHYGWWLWMLQVCMDGAKYPTITYMLEVLNHFRDLDAAERHLCLYKVFSLVTRQVPRSQEHEIFSIGSVLLSDIVENWEQGIMPLVRLIWFYLTVFRVTAPALNSRPVLKSPWISQNRKSPWIVLEKECKALKSLEFVYRETFNKTWWLGDCANFLPSCYKAGRRTAWTVLSMNVVHECLKSVVFLEYH